MRGPDPSPRRPRPLLLAFGALLAFPATALALDAPALTSTPSASPTLSTARTFAWSPPGADEGSVLIRYRGGLDGVDAPIDLGTTSAAFSGLREGTHRFAVRAVQQVPATETEPAGDEVAGPRAALTFRIDLTPPTLSVRAPGPNGQNGWYSQTFTVDFQCTDASTITVCGPDVTFRRQVEAPNEESQGPTSVTGTARDVLGNARRLTAGPYRIDMIGPRGGQPATPGVNARLAAEPLYTWTAGGDGTSGVQRYEVMVSGVPGGTKAIARVGPTRLSAMRDPVLRAALPERVPITWWVRTTDNAGNETSTSKRTFTIDSTAPPPPVITSGPAGPTNVRTPAFGWTGTQPRYEWNVSAAGAAEAVQSGTTTAPTITLAPLTDGAYTLSVAQITAAGAGGVEAARSFEVDTVAPAMPTVTARPPFPTLLATPAFAWSSDPGNTFRWQVIGQGGASAQGPASTTTAAATLSALGPGAYTFRVAQVDPAGNASAFAVDPFTIVGAAPIAVASTPKARLPARNASRLRPRAGRVLMTRSPLLLWSRGPAGTSLYNVQIFRVTRKTATRPATVRKIHSAFRHIRRFRVPKAEIRAGSCYVWRVWPYRGAGFTRAPLGVSNFCIGDAKALKAAARRAALAAARR